MADRGKRGIINLTLPSARWPLTYEGPCHFQTSSGKTAGSLATTHTRQVRVRWALPQKDDWFCTTISQIGQHMCLWVRVHRERPEVCARVKSAHSQLMSGVNRGLVHHAVVLQPELLQLAVVSECPPLCVHAHAAFLPFHQLHSPHLLHVARIAASAWPEKHTP